MSCVVHLVFDLKAEKETTMEIRDLMNINELSVNFYQVKFYIHCWETLRNPVTSYTVYVLTAYKLTELFKFVDF